MNGISPKSLIAVSMHKAGSSVANRIILEFAKAKGYAIEQITSAVAGSARSEESVFLEYAQKLKPAGVYYGMARGPYVEKMPGIDALRVIVQVRDPRDCITSLYYSWRESHVLPSNPEKRKVFEERREKVASTDIDSFARQSTQNYRNRLTIIADILARHPDCLLLTYEEMVGDTNAWLDRIGAFLDQPLTAPLRAAIAKHADFEVDGEDSARHKRQVVPGDHARKLRPETVSHLTKALKAELERFGYGQ
ncbi:MAG: sulfotransferase domain-containing protein [Pseudomonadota bacterium]